MQHNPIKTLYEETKFMIYLIIKLKQILLLSIILNIPIIKHNKYFRIH